MPRRSTRKNGGGKGKKERGKGKANARNSVRNQQHTMRQYQTIANIERRVLSREPRPANLPKNEKTVWKMREQARFPENYVPTCEICDKTTKENGTKLFICEGCKDSSRVPYVARYCSQEHQREDWPYHKKFCGYKKNAQ